MRSPRGRGACTGGGAPSETSTSGRSGRCNSGGAAVWLIASTIQTAALCLQQPSVATGRGEQQIAELARGAVATATRGHVVRAGTHLDVRIGHRAGETRALQQRQIGP